MIRRTNKMPTMTKRVNVRATVAVRNINPPIYGTYKNIIMTTGDILKCLTKRATVDEILPDGSTIRLNYKNYYTDNGAGLDAKGEIKVIKPKQPPVKKVAPVEPEKSDTDITFNQAPMSNVDETENVVETEPDILVTEGDSEDGINRDVKETTIEDSLGVLKDENGEEVDVPAGDVDDEPAKIETEESEGEAPTILATEGGSEDEKITVTSEIEEAGDNKVSEESASATEDNSTEVAPNEKTEEKAEPVSKPATAAKKKSTTSKKKK